MKNPIESVIWIVLAAFMLLFLDFSASFESPDTELKIEYHGLIWVGLDYYSIWKYKSKDTPMKWIKVTRL